MKEGVVMTNEMYKKLCLSNFFIGKKDLVNEFCSKKESESCQKCIDNELSEDAKKNKNNLLEKIRLYLKNYLQLDNVSFLFGSGSTFYLETKGIGAFPKDIETAVDSSDNSDYFWELMAKYKFNLSQNRDIEFDNSTNIPRWKNEPKEMIVPFEDFMNYLYCLKNYTESVTNIDDSETELKKLSELIVFLKQELFKLCKIEGDPKYHKYFLKSLLTRPINLQRANIFTTNYDLAFENAFDDLGITYIDGFSGFHHRYFRPEVFDYDYFYPGSKTEGKVRKIERVVKYFKLHGSLTWIKEQESSNNLYGLREMSSEYIESHLKQAGDIIIYPTTLKKGYTLDFPYSEMFRHFATAISKPQSVLITIGYSFFDEHINDIIYQALSIPSFTLIIIDKKGTYTDRENSPLKRLFELGDSRVIILQGDFLGTFEAFSETLMPDFHEYEVREKVLESLKKLHEDSTISDTVVQNDSIEQHNVTGSIDETDDKGFVLEQAEDEVPF